MFMVSVIEDDGWATITGVEWSTPPMDGKQVARKLATSGDEFTPQQEEPPQPAAPSLQV